MTLLSHGADLFAKNNEGKTPFVILQEEGYYALYDKVVLNCNEKLRRKFWCNAL